METTAAAIDESFDARPAVGRTVWLTGLPSAGKTTLAHAFAARLREEGVPVEVLDGDVLREALGKGLGFSREDREENVRRIGFVADLLSRNGVTTVCAVISPYRSTREEIRTRHDGRFVEVWVATPTEVCAERDVKGLYAKQRSGEISHLTGVDDPYEAPLAAELVLHTQDRSVDECVEALWLTLNS
ncbi:MAG: adenylylsulfate kinase [Actinomycetia bacterium]|jgi:adenylylsulfate kinase|nr:adenylylsulfate kinase [Actinomycetes bacterium]